MQVLVALSVGLMLTGCGGGGGSTTKSALQLSDEASRALRNSRQLADEGNLAQADDWLERARQITSQAESEARNARSQRALEALEQTRQELANLARQRKAVEDAAIAARRQTVVRSADLAQEAQLRQEVVASIAQDVVCDYLDFPRKERRAMTWEDVAGFIREATVKQGLPAYVRFFVDRAQQFNAIARVVVQSRDAIQAPPHWFEVRYCLLKR